MEEEIKKEEVVETVETPEEEDIAVQAPAEETEEKEAE